MKVMWFLAILLLPLIAQSQATNDKRDIELIPFSEEDFVNFYKEFVPEYADVMYRAHMFDDEQKANIAANTQMSSLFPVGLATKGQFLLKIQSHQEAVGYLWYAEKENTAWLCYIYVKPLFRNMGYAKASIIKMETHLRSLGITRVGMNVFAINPHAKKLYEALGYSVVHTILTPDQQEVIRYELSKDL